MQFSKVDFQISLLTVTGLSLFVGILMMFIAFFTSRMTGKKENIPFDILNLSGYNIGNFCLPFAQSFLEPLSLLGITPAVIIMKLIFMQLMKIKLPH